MKTLCRIVPLALLVSLPAAAAPAPQPISFGEQTHASRLVGLTREQAANLINNSKYQVRKLLSQFGDKVGIPNGQMVDLATLNCAAFTIQLGVVHTMAAQLDLPPETIAWAQFQADYWCGGNGKGGDPTKGRALLKAAAEAMPDKTTGPKTRDLSPEHAKPLPPDKRRAVASVKPTSEWTAAQAGLVVGVILWGLVVEGLDFVTFALP